MDLLEVIEKRRTIRKFSAPPTEQQIERVLEAGSKAPSAGNKQAWFVIIVNNHDTREKLGEIKRKLSFTFLPDTEETRIRAQMQKEVFNDCTSLVFYTYAPEPDDEHRYDMGSAWLFVENLCLTAVSEGLGTQLFAVWGDAEGELNELLGVPDRFKYVVGVNIGVPHLDYKPSTKVFKPQSEWIFQEKWPME